MEIVGHHHMLICCTGAISRELQIGCDPERSAGTECGRAGGRSVRRGKNVPPSSRPEKPVRRAAAFRQGSAHSRGLPGDGWKSFTATRQPSGRARVRRRIRLPDATAADLGRLEQAELVGLREHRPDVSFRAGAVRKHGDRREDRTVSRFGDTRQRAVVTDREMHLIRSQPERAAFHPEGPRGNRQLGAAPRIEGQAVPHARNHRIETIGHAGKTKGFEVPRAMGVQRPQRGIVLAGIRQGMRGRQREEPCGFGLQIY